MKTVSGCSAPENYSGRGDRVRWANPVVENSFGVEEGRITAPILRNSCWLQPANRAPQ
jgi:hypothetical protein